MATAMSRQARLAACWQKLDGLPDLLSVHAQAPARWPFLLASSAAAGSLGRWSILLAADTQRLELRPEGLRGGGDAAGFLPRLKQWVGPARSDFDPGPLPFCGGWFLYLGYELVGEIEPGLGLPPAVDGLPVALAVRCPAALLHDHQTGQTWLSADSPEALSWAGDQLPAAGSAVPIPPQPVPPLDVGADDGEQFKAGVARIRDWILDGDVFQVNLSRAWRARSAHRLDPVALYQALAMSNPAPFAGLAHLPGGILLSSSPERLVSIRGDRVDTRPIAGTRPRGASPEQDSNLSAELVAHPKERAEHIMLIDLERNDLGRVCRPGTVEVDELMVIESYAHVHHIVSNVTGRLRPGLHAADVIAAVFPGGTITGCPKVRCMQIIAELEGQGRGFYTGAMGYLGHDGALDLNILIRSMLVGEHTVSFRTGAGIVADSDPAAELAETEAKARGLLRALQA